MIGSMPPGGPGMRRPRISGIDMAHSHVRPELVQHRGGNLYVAVCIVGGVVPAPQDPLITMEAGDLLFVGTQPPRALPGESALRLFRIPCSYLRVHRGQLHRLTGTHVPGRTGVAALASRFLVAFTSDDAFGRTAGGRLVAHRAADLVALLAVELLDASPNDASPNDASPNGASPNEPSVSGRSRRGDSSVPA